MSESPHQRFAYRAFISYSHADKAWADWLHKALETYRVPSRLVGTTTAHGAIPRRLNPIFRDRDELASAAELGRKINEALAQSENLIVICSPASAASRWVNEEVLAYKRLGHGERIFCLIVAGEPDATDLPGRAAEECFCPALRFQLDASGQPANERTEPIAADARPGKDGKPNAKLKLIAGMLDVGFDALKQREQHRKMRRMAAVTAIAVCVMAVTIVLAIAALVSRHRAVVAEQEAVVAQQAAQRRQKQAEDLINFMLGDLSTKLRRVDRLDIMQAVDNKAMAYFKSLPPTDVSATALAQRAKALQRIGEVRMNNSRLGDAMGAFQQALRLNRQLVNASPNDAARQNAYAENLLWVGFADWNGGKLDAAEAAFKASAAALEHAVALAPSNDSIARNLDDIYNNLGHVAQARGELGYAQQEFSKDEALCQRMANADPRSADWKYSLGTAYDNLATLALMRGQLDAAIAGYLREHDELQASLAQHPGDRQVREELVISDAILGRTLALAGLTRVGAAYVEAALSLGASDLEFDPTHNGWRDSHAFYSALLGTLRLAQGDIRAATQPIAASIAALQALVNKDRSNTGWAGNLAEAQLAGARLALARGQPQQAAQLGDAALVNLQKPLQDDPRSAESLRTQASVRLVLAQAAATTGDGDAAANSRQRALAIARRAAAHSADPRTLAVLVEALLASGQNAEAAPYVASLQRMGYQPLAFIALLRQHGIDYPANPAFDARIASLLRSTGATPSRTASIHGDPPRTSTASNGGT